MRAAIALLLVAVAAALLWWVLSPSSGAPLGAPAGEGSMDAAAPSEVSPSPPAQPTLPSRPVVAPRPKPPAVSGPWNPDRGDLVVALTVPEGTAAPAAPKMEIELLGPSLPSMPLPLVQPDGTWKYEGLPVGRYRVWVLCDGWRDAYAEGKVEKDGEGRIDVAMTPGASATFKVTNWFGQDPPKFSVVLLDGRMMPVAASWELPANRFRVPAGKAVEMPPEGRVIGLKPGTYTLRATSEEGETDEATFQARVGRVASVELKLKK